MTTSCSGRRQLLRVVPPHKLRVNRRPRQQQRVLNADFVLQPRRASVARQQCAEAATRDRP
jgi:hypothetical protein